MTSLALLRRFGVKAGPIAFYDSGPPGLNLHFFVSLAGAIVLCLVYTWFYEESVSDGPREDHNESLLRLSRVGERLRWRLAAIAMYTILADLLFGDVRSWGIYGALLVGVVGYFTGNIVTTGFGSYEISETQQAWHRRFAIVPALLLFYKGTDFHGNLAGTFVLSASLVVVLILILVPEPSQ